MPRKQVTEIEINQEWCKRCGICSSFCPKSVFATDEHGNVRVEAIDACIACELCERMCPDLAIRLVYAAEEAS